MSYKCSAVVCFVLLEAVWIVSARSFLNRGIRSVDGPPVLLGLEALDPPGVVVTWQTMHELAGEPIDGYKVHVWELRDVKTEEYILVDGRPVKQIIGEPVQVENNVFTLQSEVIDVPGADSGKVIYRPAKLDTQYEVRVQAYNREGTGLLSNAVGIKLWSK